MQVVERRWWSARSTPINQDTDRQRWLIDGADTTNVMVLITGVGRGATVSGCLADHCRWLGSVIGRVRGEETLPRMRPLSSQAKLPRHLRPENGQQRRWLTASSHATLLARRSPK